MKHKILQKLQELEAQHHIKIFYAVESGSRAWGFESPDSDYDIRFLYFHQPEWYFAITKHPDYINYMSPDHLLDFSGWDLKKTLQVLLKGNMSLYEWSRSSIVYVQTEEYAAFSHMMQEFHDPKALLFSYMALANNNYKAYLQHEDAVKAKKYLYVLRTLAACYWLENKQTPPPIEMDKLKQVFQSNPLVWDFLIELLAKKKQKSELSFIPPHPQINAWIKEQIEHYQDLATQLPALTKDPMVLSHFLYTTVMKKSNLG